MGAAAINSRGPKIQAPNFRIPGNFRNPEIWGLNFRIPETFHPRVLKVDRSVLVMDFDCEFLESN
jgi:hypothetical protein